SNSQQMYSWDEIWEYDEVKSIFALESMIVMQYTGLKDKNGKEIYEGDILAGREVHQDNFFCIVKWGPGGFYGHTVPGYNHFKPITYMMEAEGTQYNEVIGNIYENPELITE